MTEELSFTRYLAAKRTVDDRALDRRVWTALAEALAERRRATGGRLAVLEVGAGSGAMIERLVGEGLVAAGRYRALDANPEVVDDGRRRLAAWAAGRGLAATRRGDRLVLSRQGGPEEEAAALVEVDLEVELVVADLFDDLAGQGGRFDLVVAHAVLDVVDLPAALALLVRALAPDGLLYCPITFDGASLFSPPVDPPLDERIAALYHRSMAARGGASDTGRRLFGELAAAGAEVFAAGASDWIVWAGADGYPGDEAYFLRHILHFFEDELAGHPELDAGRFADWLARRRAQIEDGSLVFVAHQLDVLARRDGRSATSASPPRSDATPSARPS